MMLSFPQNEIARGVFTMLWGLFYAVEIILEKVHSRDSSPVHEGTKNTGSSH